MSFSKTVRKKVYDKFDGHCAYCGEKIDLEDMEIDHVKSIRQGGTNDFDNLFPSCELCNHYKNLMDLEGLREYLKTLHEWIANDYNVKVGMRFGVINLKPFDGTFFFEFYNSKPKEPDWRYTPKRDLPFCPKCGIRLYSEEKRSHCPKCGQPLDWEVCPG